jgi:hypothetical protein
MTARAEIADGTSAWGGSSTVDGKSTEPARKTVRARPVKAIKDAVG